MTDLKERLRAIEHGDDGGFGPNVTHWYRNPDGLEAADEIERLERELEKATNVAERVRAAKNRIAELQERVLALEEALRPFGTHDDSEREALQSCDDENNVLFWQRADSYRRARDTLIAARNEKDAS